MEASWHPVFYILVIYVALNSHLATSGNPLIDIVCGTTTFADYCRIRFMSRPSSFHADMHKLGDIAIHIAIYDASMAVAKAQQLISQTKDVALAQKLKICMNGYHSAWAHLKDASKMWAVNNFGAVRNIAYGDLDAVFACRESLGKFERLMGRNNRDVEYMSHIVLVICDYLS